MNQYILLAMAIIGVVTVYIAIVLIFQRNAKRARAVRSFYLPEEEDAFDPTEQRSPMVVFCSEALAAIGISVKEARKDLYAELGKAGLINEAQVTYFLFFRFFGQFLALLFAAFLLVTLFIQDISLLSSTGLTRLLLIFIFGMIGLRGHKELLDKLEKKRKQTLTDSFPDAMDLLLVCIEAGMPLDSALARVCREMKRTHPLITQELDRTRIELGVYGDRTQALQNLADRTDIKGFRTLVSALIQTEKYGTNLADTLRVLADDLRTERLLKAENKAARVPALITVPVIMFIFFPFIALIMAPPIITFIQQGAWPD